MEHTYFFAVDLGATSGRTILGCLGEGKMELKELTRFPNHIIETGGHCYWDIYALYNEIIRGLKVVAKDNLPIRSIGIDTWGVDFVFAVSYTHLRAHETGRNLVCRLLLEKKKKKIKNT